MEVDMVTLDIAPRTAEDPIRSLALVEVVDNLNALLLILSILLPLLILPLLIMVAQAVDMVEVVVVAVVMEVADMVAVAMVAQAATPAMVKALAMETLAARVVAEVAVEAAVVVEVAAEAAEVAVARSAEVAANPVAVLDALLCLPRPTEEDGSLMVVGIESALPFSRRILPRPVQSPVCVRAHVSLLIQLFIYLFPLCPLVA